MNVWEWPVVIYLWLVGMVAGAYAVAFLNARLTGRGNGLLTAATLFGVVGIMIGAFLLVLDLGHPLRVWHLFVRFRIISTMSLGTWLLIAWAAFGLVVAVLWRVPELKMAKGLAGVLGRRLFPLAKAVEQLSWVLFVLAFLVMSYTGVLLSSSNRPLWAATVLLPALFVASATSTGVALLLLVLSTRPGRVLVAFFGGRVGPHDGLEGLGRASAAFGILELIVLLGFLVWLSLWSSEGAADAIRLLTLGPLWPFFWGGVVLFGLILPLALELGHGWFARKSSELSVVASTIWVLVGGLMLRTVIVIGGQIYR
ncbi:MAG: NrfD/PsrC family molybdoenzyme membrane anchor subunit [Anaerolineae bacterium]